MSWWRWRLATDDEAVPSLDGFVEVALPNPAEPIDVVLRNGRVVRVPAVFDEDALGRVLAMAEAS